jgi:hypothetical protein
LLSTLAPLFKILIPSVEELAWSLLLTVLPNPSIEDSAVFVELARSGIPLVESVSKVAMVAIADSKLIYTVVLGDNVATNGSTSKLLAKLGWIT